MTVDSGLGISADAQTTGLVTTGLSIVGGTLAVPSVAAALLGIASTSAIIPFIGPIVAGVVLAVGFILRDPNGPLKVATTNIVNQIEPYMKQNIVAAQQQAVANGGCLTSGEVAALVDNFNQLWQAVVTKCSDPQFKQPGQVCISDRQRGGKWDWFSYYLDPIKAYPVCVSASSDIASATSGVLSSLTGGGSSTYLLLGAVALLVAVLSGKD